MDTPQRLRHHIPHFSTDIEHDDECPLFVAFALGLRGLDLKSSDVDDAYKRYKANPSMFMSWMTTARLEVAHLLASLALPGSESQELVAARIWCAFENETWGP